MSEMADIISAIGGGGGVLVTIGAAARFVWHKVENRLTAIEKELAQCRQRETDSLERRATQITVIELLWAKLHELAPEAPVLQRAKKLLDDLKSKAAEGEKED